MHNNYACFDPGWLHWLHLLWRRCCVAADFIQQRRLGLTESVTAQDIAFAVHAALITYATVGQCIVWKVPIPLQQIWRASFLSSNGLLMHTMKESLQPLISEMYC
jgi:hypothetical protein